MKLFVRAKAGARQERVEKINDSTFLISVKEEARDGRANVAVARALARYFDIPSSDVRLISGFSSPHKKFEILW